MQRSPDGEQHLFLDGTYRVHRLAWWPRSIGRGDIGFSFGPNPGAAAASIHPNPIDLSKFFLCVANEVAHVEWSACRDGAEGF